MAAILPTKKQLEQYVRFVANEMGLRDWEIVLAFYPSLPPREGVNEEGHNAAGSCSTTAGAKQATINFPNDWSSYGRAFLREVVVHELVHCHFGHPWDVVTFAAQRSMGDAERRTFLSAFELAMEIAVDGTAVEWARKLPLMELPKQKPRRARRKRSAGK
jgi:hypothetical protein